MTGLKQVQFSKKTNLQVEEIKAKRFENGECNYKKKDITADAIDMLHKKECK